MTMYDEEIETLERVRAAIARASRARPAVDRAAILRGLREQAQSAAEDDLPSLLLEMSVQSSLLEREAPVALPDPARPYLARLRIREGKAVKDYLLGHVPYLAPSEGIRIVDFRTAPIARVFHRYLEGDAFEEEIGPRTLEGVVLVRRVIAIVNGEVRAIRAADGVHYRVGSDWRHAPEPTLETGMGRGKRADGRASPLEIHASLDDAQRAAVEAPAERPMLVLGMAGSGKTTVALHRLLRTADGLDGTRVIVPHEGLARLARKLLRAHEGARVDTLDAALVDMAHLAFGARVKLAPETPAHVAALKRHPALFDALSATAPKKRTFAALKRRLHDAFTDRTFLAAVVDRAPDLRRAAIEETVAHTLLQMAEPLSRELASITDEERKRAIDGLPIDEGTPLALAGTIDPEDVPILLSLSARRSLPAPMRHLVLDEAEDFSLFDLDVLRANCAAQRTLTLAGDEAQQTSSCFAGWERSLATLGASDAAICRLEVSYRCPAPVAALARRITGRPGEQAARSGAPVRFVRLPDESYADLYATSAALALSRREPRATIAILAHDEDAARRIQGLLDEDARLASGGDIDFEPGIDVLDVESAKGLEFDYVLVPDASAARYPDTGEARRRLHVAITRATHALMVVCGGVPSPILAHEGWSSELSGVDDVEARAAAPAKAASRNRASRGA